MRLYTGACTPSKMCVCVCVYMFVCMQWKCCNTRVWRYLLLIKILVLLKVKNFTFQQKFCLFLSKTLQIFTTAIAIAIRYCFCFLKRRAFKEKKLCKVQSMCVCMCVKTINNENANVLRTFDEILLLLFIFSLFYCLIFYIAYTASPSLV